MCRLKAKATLTWHALSPRFPRSFATFSLVVSSLYDNALSTPQTEERDIVKSPCKCTIALSLLVALSPTIEILANPPWKTERRTITQQQLACLWRRISRFNNWHTYQRVIQTNMATEAESSRLKTTRDSESDFYASMTVEAGSSALAKNETAKTSSRVRPWWAYRQKTL
jgi:hypothetical protein